MHLPGDDESHTVEWVMYSPRVFSQTRHHGMCSNEAPARCIPQSTRQEATMNFRLALLAASLAAMSAPAFAGDDPCSQLARETGLSERKINMILGNRTSFAEYRYTYERSVEKLRESIGEGRYDQLM